MSVWVYVQLPVEVFDDSDDVNARTSTPLADTALATSPRPPE